MGEAGKIEETIRRLEADPRNRSYTDRGIPPVFQLSPEARILIVGQAPGKKVEETRIPFNDKSGEKLMQWLGIDRDTFYSDRIAILPMDFYYPGKGKTGDLPPRDFIAREYHEELLSLMPGLRLKILIGSYSTRYYLGKRAERNLTETVRNYRAYLPMYFPIVHPSPLNFRWQRKNPWFLEEVIPALRERVGQILQEEKA